MGIKIIGLFFMLIGLACICSPFVYWFLNDVLTGMQLFKKLWYLHVGGYAMLFTGQLLQKIDYLR